MFSRILYTKSNGRVMTGRVTSTSKKGNMQKHISPHLTLWEETDPPHFRPLVLLFPWLGHTQKALSQYRNLYHNRGMDVLTIHSSAGEFLHPQRAIPISKELFDYLKCRTSSSPIYVHAMSIGAFIYSVCLHEMMSSPDVLSLFKQNVKGQIFDSIVIGSTQQMSVGVSTFTSGNIAVRKLISSMLNCYFFLTQNSVVKEYDKYIHAFTENPLTKPGLFLYALNDPMCNADALAVVTKRWGETSAFVQEKCWEKSKHVQHLKLHNKDYITALDKFLAECKPISSNFHSNL